MKNFLVALSISVLATACNVREERGLAKPIDSQQLEKLEKTNCPIGTNLKIFSEEIELYKDPLPAFYVIGIQKGNLRCALEGSYNLSGLDSWLNIQFSNSCLENGSLWINEELTISDSVKVNWKLGPIDGNSPGHISIQTNYKHSLNEIRSAAGFIVYSCQ